jgi:hypothetical protein
MNLKLLSNHPDQFNQNDREADMVFLDFIFYKYFNTENHLRYAFFEAKS